MQAGGNKDYLADRVIDHVQLQDLKDQLKNLLYGEAPIQQRYNEFRAQVKYIGPAQITEILCHVNPKEYGIWNTRSRKALEMLGFGYAIPLKQQNIDGETYVKFNSILKQIASLLSQKLGDVDLLAVDYFLYFISTQKPSEEMTAISVQRPSEEMVEIDHDYLVECLEAIGSSLGFDVEPEVTIARGARVDLVWRAKLGNIGSVQYVFEVVKTKGSIDSAILNLQRAARDPRVQKLVVVGSPEVIEQFRAEVDSISEELAKHIIYLEAGDVIRGKELLEQLDQILIRKLMR